MKMTKTKDFCFHFHWFFLNQAWQDKQNPCRTFVLFDWFGRLSWGDCVTWDCTRTAGATRGAKGSKQKVWNWSEKTGWQSSVNLWVDGLDGEHISRAGGKRGRCSHTSPNIPLVHSDHTRVPPLFRFSMQAWMKDHNPEKQLPLYKEPQKRYFDHWDKLQKHETWS